MLLGTCYETWLESRKNEIAPATYYDYSRVDQYLGELWSRPLGELKPNDLYSLLMTVPPGRRRRVKTVINQMFAWAILTGAVESNPLMGLRIPSGKQSNEVIAVPSPEEVAALVGAAGDYGTFILTAAWSGLRFGELGGLKWGDVDFDKRKITVQRTLCSLTRTIREPKTAKSKRRVSVHPKVISALDEFRHDREFVFSQTSGSLIHHSNFSRRVWKPAKEAVGVDYRFHDLRHFYATALVEKGVPIGTVSQMLGHSSSTVTLKMYAGFFPDNHERVEEAFDEYFVA